MRHLAILVILGILSGAVACKSDGTDGGGGDSDGMAGRSGGDSGNGGGGDDGDDEGRDGGERNDGESGAGGAGGGGGGGGDPGSDAGTDAGETADAGDDTMADAATDAGSFDFVTEADCDDLPATFDGYDPEYEMHGDVCVEIDWAMNPCVVHRIDCPGDGLFFEWSREEGGYFNLKFYGTGDPIESTAGTVNPKPTGIFGAPASVSGLPVGEIVEVKIDDPENVNYDIRFRRDGDALTIDSIMQRE